MNKQNLSALDIALNYATEYSMFESCCFIEI